jgi:hypothetical protein
VRKKFGPTTRRHSSALYHKQEVNFFQCGQHSVSIFSLLRGRAKFFRWTDQACIRSSKKKEEKKKQQNE